MRKTIGAILTIVLASAAMSVQAGGDPAAGKAKAAACTGCHGAKGISGNPLWPNLAGQKEAYLIKQMKGFRDGKREDPMMAPMAKGLSDTDIANIAAYYANL